MTYPSKVTEAAAPPPKSEDAQPEEEAALDPVCEAREDHASFEESAVSNDTSTQRHKTQDHARAINDVVGEDQDPPRARGDLGANLGRKVADGITSPRGRKVEISLEILVLIVEGLVRCLSTGAS
jgi:hypothetical protein